MDDLGLRLGLRLGSDVDGDATGSRRNINDGPVGGTLTRGLDGSTAGAAVVDGNINLGAGVAGATAVAVGVGVVAGAVALTVGANGAAHDGAVILKVFVATIVAAGPGSELHVAVINVMVNMVMFVFVHGFDLRGRDNSTASGLGVDTHYYEGV